MYCEEQMIKAKVCSGDERKQLMEESFFANLGLTVQLLKEFGMNQNNHDDFMQLAYLAFDTTVRVFSADSGYSMLAYYRMNLKHECYVYWRRQAHDESVGLCADEVKSLYKERTRGLSEEVEEQFMSQALWGRAREVLSSDNYLLIEKRYRKEETLKRLGSYFNLTAEGARKRLLSVCKQLRADTELQGIAKYYHY